MPGQVRVNYTVLQNKFIPQFIWRLMVKSALVPRQSPQGKFYLYANQLNYEALIFLNWYILQKSAY
ncbi:MAG: hypothetical protein B7X86_17045 [Sphingobacteriales bacterium 17-39-43]|nr:MAG: hypothetical protein B7Y76_03000 [Sphingobacteriia bacterium 35-40-5]OZA21949.1 MAG: hypothetical protein B7X86_17045 [Sphingobacteriales bacterium 17-39-43]